MTDISIGFEFFMHKSLIVIVTVNWRLRDILRPGLLFVSYCFLGLYFTWSFFDQSGPAPTMAQTP